MLSFKDKIINLISNILKIKKLTISLVRIKLLNIIFFPLVFLFSFFLPFLTPSLTSVSLLLYLFPFLASSPHLHPVTKMGRKCLKWKKKERETDAKLWQCWKREGAKERNHKRKNVIFQSLIMKKIVSFLNL